jgi:hypothetical protein
LYVVAFAFLALATVVSLVRLQPVLAGLFAAGLAVWWGRRFQVRHRRIRRRAVLAGLPTERLEQLVADLLVRAGWRDATWAPAGRREDGLALVGRDPAGRRGLLMAVALPPAAALGAPTVHRLLATAFDQRCDRALLVTTGRFTQAAAAVARGGDVELVDGDALVRSAERAGWSPGRRGALSPRG